MLPEALREYCGIIFLFVALVFSFCAFILPLIIELLDWLLTKWRKLTKRR